MLSSGFHWGHGRFALALSAALALLACRKPTAQKPPAQEAPHGAGLLPPSIDAAEDYTPLKAPPTAEELRRFPLLEAERPADLTRPVAWRQNPYKSRSWGMQLQAWRFMPPILLGYDKYRDPRLLRLAADYALDWLGAHRSAKTAKKPFVWYDMAVAARATYLAYLVRAGGVSGVLDASERKQLLDAVIGHGEWLADKSNYLEKHNHGLYSDMALLVVCQTLDRLERCGEWRKLALRRFAATFSATVTASGFHREHTPSYHFAMIRLLERRLATEDDADLRRTLTAMREAGAWYLQPDGEFPQLGEAHRGRGPEWARAAAAKLNGARFVEDSGLYFFKNSASQLLVTGAHHGYVHKQQDDLSFVLFEGGRPLLIDPGFYSYNKTPERAFLTSARAHNVFLVDERYVQPKKLPQLSLRSSGESGGFYAVTGDDVHTLSEVGHERTWLYSPGKVLLVIDDYVGDGQEHALTRYFHFAADVQTEPVSRGVRVKGPSLEGELFDASKERTEVETFKGLRQPPFQGIAAPTEEVLVDAPAVEMKTRVGRGNATLLSVLELTRRPERGKYAVRERKPGALSLLVDGQLISLERDGAKLKIAVGAPSK
jgi:hypothetical protein